MRPLLSTLLTLLLLAPSARSADNPDPAALAAAVQPHLDDGALLVLHADLTRADLTALHKTLDDTFRRMNLPKAETDQISQQLAGGMAVGRQWIADVTKTGARDVFVVLSAEHLPQPPIYLVIPLPQTADPAALTNLFTPLAQPLDGVAEVRGRTLLVGPKPALDRLKTLKPQPRPDLAKALESAGPDAALRLAFVPTADARKVLAEMLPALPPAIAGDGPEAREPVINHVRWLGAAVKLAPDLSLRAVVQSPDPRRAAALAGIVNRLVAATGDEVRRWIAHDDKTKAAIPMIEQAVKALTTKTEGDRVTLDLAGEQMLTLSAVLAPALAKQRERALAQRSMSNVRQILIGCAIYANENKGQYPPDLQTLIKTIELPPATLQHPADPARKNPYVYLRPAAGDAAPLDQIVVYERPDPNSPTVTAGFLDGRAELMPREAFDKALAATQARNTPKP
jgi:hypothetical protein